MLRVAAIIWAMAIPGLQIYLFRRKFPDLEANHLRGPTSFPLLLADMISKGWVVWNKSKYTFKFWNGASINLCHCQKEDDRFNYLGAEIHVLLIDELAQFTPVIYKFLRTRVRMVGIELPDQYKGKFPRILCGSNPGGPCHHLMKSSWVDRAPPLEYYQAEQSDGGMLRQFIPARIRDNPTLMKEDPDYPNRLRGLGNDQLVKAYLDGDFSVIIGGMFDDLWTPGIHVIRPFRIPNTFYFNRSFDWGSSKPFSIGYFAEADDSTVTLSNGLRRSFYPGTIIQVAEWYGTVANDAQPDVGVKLTAREIAVGMKEIEKQMPYKFRIGPADSNIFDSTNDNCIATDMEDEGIAWEDVPGLKAPGSRKLGWEAMRNRLQASLKYPMEAPGIFFFSNCLNSIRTIPGTQRSDFDSEDVAKGIEDHALDMIRYRIRTPKTLVRESDLRAF